MSFPSFPVGKPIGVMLLLALASGMVVFSRRPPPRSDQVVWVFAESHARVYRGDNESKDSPGQPSLIQHYAARTGRTVQVDLLAQRALDTRLLSLFMSPDRSQTPDLAEVEISSVSKFFRLPVNEVGFLPLNKYLEESGLMNRLLPQRLSPWSKQGVIFGVPHDVHPVTITYRRDLFAQAGVDLASAGTWAEFQKRCLDYQRYWREHGDGKRWAVALPASSADDLVVMLLQRQVNLVDEDERPHLTDEKVARTLAFYAQLVAGRDRISASPSAGVLWTRDLSQGDVAAAITPDWAIADLREYAPELSGKLAMMPLPRFDPDDSPTSTWGGTMIGIPRACPDPDAAWDLLKFLYFSPEALEARRRYSTILPPDRKQWEAPEWHRPDAFFGGQKIGELYVELAERIPRRYVTPFSAMATSYLSAVLSRAVDQVNERGSEGLAEACWRWLGEAQRQLEKRIEFGKVEE